jgi:hypothetical protein
VILLAKLLQQNGTLCLETGLAVEKYEAEMLTSGIIRRRGDNFTIPIHL